MNNIAAINLRTVGIIMLVVSAVLISILGFVKINIDKRGVFLCEAVAQNPSLSMQDCPVHTDYSTWLLLAAFGIAFLVLGGGVYFFIIGGQTTEPPKPTASSSVDTSTLNPEEKQIHDLLVGHEGSIYQSDIIKETGWSKVKVTRILDKMEGKHVIDRKRRGMTNIVLLK
ncbi:hypothetical protein HZB01_04705 [Candidatus Woesearchaeota archaeon]|nr:hypothetical protein [Candidatus Woesearchaeota archaeon]